ncbi:MAG TPA: hypothetical protein VF710_16380 [Longimicrobium sp.]
MIVSIVRPDPESPDLLLLMRVEGPQLLGDADATVSPGEEFYGVSYDELLAHLGQTIDVAALAA